MSRALPAGCATPVLPSTCPRCSAATARCPTAEEGVAVFQRACMSAEFRAMAANASSPVTQWLRALARLAHGECGGPGRRRHRHVLYRQFRADHDAGAGDAGAGAVAAVAAAQRAGGPRDRAGGTRRGARAARARRSHRARLSLRGRQDLPGRTFRRLCRRARRSLHRPRAAGRGRQQRRVAVLRQTRPLPAQRRHPASDRRGRPADDRRARRDSGLLPGRLAPSAGAA